MYLLYDRRTNQVLANSNRKSDLIAIQNGVILNAKKPEKDLTSTELITFYKTIKGKEVEIQRPTKAIIKEVSKALEDSVQREPAVSTVEKPVEFVRTMCTKLRDKSRKEVIDACVAAGIAYNTAKTQYQKWVNTQAA